MPFIKLTQTDGKIRKDLYINSDQIVRVAEPIGASDVYKATLLLANGSQDVLETVAEVMARIKNAKADE